MHRYCTDRSAHTQTHTHRVEEDISINYSLEMSGEEILIVSESLIEFRWQTCADMLLVKPSANRHKHWELHAEGSANRRNVFVPCVCLEDHLKRLYRSLKTVMSSNK